MNTSLREGEFAFLAHTLEAWPDLPPSTAHASTPVARLIHAARAAAEGSHEVGAADLAVLLRHVLRADAEITGASNGLRVPDGEAWPRDDEWADFGLRATADRLVFADEWRPDWLTGSRDPCASAFRGCHTESLGDILAMAADPFLEGAAGLALPFDRPTRGDRGRRSDATDYDSDWESAAGIGEKRCGLCSRADG